MTRATGRWVALVVGSLVGGLLGPALAGAASPFETGANTLRSDLLAILTPIAVIAVMGLGIAAAFAVISWRWVIGSLGGIVLIFGATQMVDWVRGAFGV